MLVLVFSWWWMSMFLMFFPCYTSRWRTKWFLRSSYTNKSILNFRLIFIVFLETSEAPASRYTPFVKSCIWNQSKSSCGSLVDTPDQKSHQVTLITNIRLSELRMVCRSDLYETKETQNFTSPSWKVLKTDPVFLTTEISWNWFKV